MIKNRKIKVNYIRNINTLTDKLTKLLNCNNFKRFIELLQLKKSF